MALTKTAKITKLLNEGKTPSDIAKTLKIRPGYVYNVRSKLNGGATTKKPQRSSKNGPVEPKTPASPRIVIESAMEQFADAILERQYVEVADAIEHLDGELAALNLERTALEARGETLFAQRQKLSLALQPNDK